MERIGSDRKNYVGYEYYEIHADSSKVSFYLDSYACFGWQQDPNSQIRETGNCIIRLKRDRRIMNRQELTRLQRHFEDCVSQIRQMEQRKASAGRAAAITAGVLGTAFMAGSVFAVTAQPPVIWLCILLAVPGFAGWILPVYLYRYFLKRETQRIEPLIGAKMDEIYEICEKGYRLTG